MLEGRLIQFQPVLKLLRLVQEVPVYLLNREGTVEIPYSIP